MDSSSVGEADSERSYDAPTTYDTHGFEVPRNLVSKYRSLEARRAGGTATASAAASWPELLEQARRKQYRAGGPLPPKFVAAVREGIPSEHRGSAWMLLSGSAQRMAAQPQLYAQLCAAAQRPGDAAVAEAIELDVRRTFPGHARLTTEFVGKMTRVLLAYAARNPEVAYCQGMNFVAASVLLFIEEEESAFWLLCYIVEEVLPDHYVSSMIGHTVDRQVTEQLVELHLPDLAAHLRALSLSMPFVTTHWFLCLFVTALPAESAFRLWDLILCLHPAWIFRACLSLFATMEAQSLLETAEIGTAVFVIKSTARGAFDGSEIIDLAAARFHEVTPELIGRLRRDWRRSTMEALHARLRVTELYEAQQQVGTFGVDQARSLILSLRLGTAAPNATVREDDVREALGRVLPEEEQRVVLAFLRSTATVAPPAGSATTASASAPAGRGGGASGADGTDAGEVAGAASPALLDGSQVAVGVAVLCDGRVEQRLRLCFEAFDGGGKESLSIDELVRLLHAVYRTYYKQPPSDADVRTAAEVVFVSASREPADGRVTAAAAAAAASAAPSDFPLDYGGPPAAEAVTAALFLEIASTQPTLVQCFAARGERPLLTPRGVSHRPKLPLEPSGPLEAIVPHLIPTCMMRSDKALQGASNRRQIRAEHLSPKGFLGGPPNARVLQSKGDFPGAALLDGLGAFGKSTVVGLSDVLGGALDGALAAMHVPLKRNPLGEQVRDADVLRMALSEASLEPPRLRLLVGFDCSASNRRAGKVIFSGKPLHASAADGVLGPDPNPYQMALFMLGKSLDAIGVGQATPVRCFCFNTTPPKAREWPPHRREWPLPPEVAPPDAPPASAAMSEATSAAAAAEMAAAAAVAASVVSSDGGGGAAASSAAPVVCSGMEGALNYYNDLPTAVFRGARGSGAASGLAQAVRYGAALAAADEADGGALTLLLVLTPAQGIDVGAARAALIGARDTPLSVVALGVGDGPFHDLGRLAAASPQNMNAVDFHAAIDTKFPDRALAVEAFRMLPEQAETAALLRASREEGAARGGMPGAPPLKLVHPQGQSYELKL